MNLKRKSRSSVMAAALLSSGACSTFYEQPVPLTERPLLYKEAVVRIIDPMHNFPNIRQRGLVLLYDKDGMRHCDIYLRDYPRYLGHESDHCFRGWWHGNEDNADDFK